VNDNATPGATPSATPNSGHRLAALVIRPAAGAEDMATARRLFEEYATWLGLDLCFQGFENELATLPGAYALPAGRLLFAVDATDVTGGGETVAGCIALRRLDKDSSGTACELKRLWVRPGNRGRHVGRALTAAALAAARDIGYATMKLDTLASLMPAAVALYRSVGFTDCAPYYHNPIPDALYMECRLRP